uniref:Reverse transcriptase Ty1/copia-type domain-containing protein n=1 Tax=Solanum lycopersicum TaxID=4081 RepID=A0A3Q7EWZ0_SOLLC
MGYVISANTSPPTTIEKDGQQRPKSIHHVTEHLLPEVVEPTIVGQGLAHPEWRSAMSDEFNALIKNCTWILVPPNSQQNLVDCKVKRNAEGSLLKYKARLVAEGYNQRSKTDFDDLIVTSNNSFFNKRFIQALGVHFSLKDPHDLSLFLGVDVHKTSKGILLSQHHYVQQILQAANMECKKEALEPTRYRQLFGSLQYINLTRSDIAFIVNKLSHFIHCPNHHHWLDLKRLVRYPKSTIVFGHHITPQSSLKFHVFSNADWAAGVPKSRQQLLDRPLKLNTGSLLQQLSRFNGLNPFLKNWDQVADLLTKPLSKIQFQLNRSKIGLLNRSSILRGSVKNNPIQSNSKSKG